MARSLTIIITFLLVVSTATSAQPSRLAAVSSSVPAQAYYNVLRYGIVNDGATDNYQKLTLLFASLDSLSGIKIVYFPDGDYVVSDGIIVPSNITILGESEAGTIIMTHEVDAQLGLGKSIFYTGGENITFRNLTLDGRYTDDPDWTYSLSESDYPERSGGIELKAGAKNVLVENVTVNNMTRNGILVRGTDITLRNITSRNCIAANIKFGGTGLGTVDGGSAANSTNGIQAFNLSLQKTLANHNIEVNDGCHNITIDGFYIYGERKCPSISVHDHSNANETNTNITFRNGEIEDPQAGGVAVLLEQQVNTNKNKNLLFEDITITNGGHYAFRIGGNNEEITLRRVTTRCERGINLTALAGLTPALNTIIEECDIQPLGPNTGDDNQPGININELDGLTVVRSEITGWESHGLLLTNASNIVVDDCDLLNNGSLQADGSSIKLVGSGSGVKILNSRLGNSGTTNSKHALTYVNGYDDFEMTGCSVVEDGTISNVNGSFAGTNSVVTNNIGIADYP